MEAPQEILEIINNWNNFPHGLVNSKKRFDSLFPHAEWNSGICEYMSATTVVEGTGCFGHNIVAN